MIPMRTSTIFKNRWWAALWAAGMIWFAYDLANSVPGDPDANNVVGEDATGAPVTTADQQAIGQALNSI